MSYLKQYILESQVKYPNISPTPWHVLDHLLFTNGNGVEFVNGNPVIEGEFYRQILFSDFYNQIIDKKDMIEYMEKYHSESEIQRDYDRIVEMNKFLPGNKTENQLWTEACEKWNRRYDNHIWVDTFSDDDLFNLDVIRKYYKSDFYQICSISKDYYKADFLTENTYPLLRKIAIAMAEFYLEKAKEVLSLDNINPKRNPFGKNQESDLLHVAKSNIKELTRWLDKNTFKPFNWVVRCTGGYIASFVFRDLDEAKEFIGKVREDHEKQYGKVQYQIEALPGLRIGDTCRVFGEGTDQFVITGLEKYSEHNYAFILDSGWCEPVFACY